MHIMGFEYSKITKTRKLPKPNQYAVALLNERQEFNYDEERVLEYRGNWRKLAFDTSLNQAMDLEIGTGNGFHFANYVEHNPDRLIVGMELKYKPLIQTVERAIRTGNKNFRVVRYTAKYLNDIFAENELNNVYIHFPDPWAYKTRQKKNRLIHADFLNNLYKMQKPGSFVEFKTDHRGYFLEVLKELRETNYQLVKYTEDLHHSIWSKENFLTHFEKLWTSKRFENTYDVFL